MKRIAVAFAVVVLVALVVGQSCNKDGPTGPGPVSNVQLAPPTPITVTPVVVAPRGDSWTENGVKVSIVSDEWGAGSCHATGGARSLKIENGSKETIYSRRASFQGTAPGCGATGENPGGKPTMLGPEQIAPGQSATVTYIVQLPATCRSQVDDTWGPGNMVFVVGDVFNSGKPCPVPTPTPTPTPSPSPSPTPSPSPSPSPTPTPCAVTWVEQPPVYGEWGACQKQPHDVSRSCTSECHQYRDKTINEKNSCTGETRVKFKGQESRDCVCPTPPPTAYCYYEPDCRVGASGSGHSSCDHEALCLALPAALQPTWTNWNGQGNQCRTILPGVYLSNFRLTPGQSDSRCLKYVGQ